MLGSPESRNRRCPLAAPRPRRSRSTSSARPARLPTAVDVLGRAFLDDPVFAWVIPDREHPASNINAFFALFAEAVQPHDEIYVADRGARCRPLGAARPAARRRRLRRRVRGTCGRARRRRTRRASASSSRRWKRTTRASRTSTSGSSPSIRAGKAAASAPRSSHRCSSGATARARRRTSRRRASQNVRLYERHGFDVVGTINEHGGAPLWPMWREPRAS